MARPSARWWCCLVAQGIVELLVDAGEGVCRPGLVLRWLSGCPCGTRVVGVSDLVFAGMLLGPEATRLGLAAPLLLWVGVGGWVLFLGVVFENCRVDASIFVVKLCRAHGGCLGIRGR